MFLEIMFKGVSKNYHEKLCVDFKILFCTGIGLPFNSTFYDLLKSTLDIKGVSHHPSGGWALKLI